MTNRHWRFEANFHTVGSLVVMVIGPNWQSAVRKAALAVKRLPQMKGRRLKAGSFTIVEIEAPIPIPEASEQLSLPQGAQGGGQTPPSTS